MSVGAMVPFIWATERGRLESTRCLKDRCFCVCYGLVDLWGTFAHCTDDARKAHFTVRRETKKTRFGIILTAVI